MHERLSLLLRSALYGMRGGFLVRPFVIALILGMAGAILSFAEEHVPALNAWIPEVLFPANQDPQVAQTILAGIASSIMTVVSIVFAILLMTLSLASTQFSPRILVSFVRDRRTQWTLGICPASALASPPMATRGWRPELTRVMPTRTIHAVSRPAAKSRLPLFAGSGVPASFNLGVDRRSEPSFSSARNARRKPSGRGSVRTSENRDCSPRPICVSALPAFDGRRNSRLPCRRFASSTMSPLLNTSSQHVVRIRADVANTAPS
jgi:predicted membrane protein DUF2254